MKKYLLIIMLVVGFCLAGCSANDEASSEPYYDGEFNEENTDLQNPESPVEPADNNGGNNDDTTVSEGAPELENRKIIYRADLEMKVVNPSDAYDNVLSTMESYTAYIEEAQIKTNYYNVTIRVLSSEFDEFVEAIKTEGELVRYSKTSEDVTNQYSTFEARKTALETRHARILELISEASNLDTILKLEEERYEIESDLNYIGTQLANYDSLIDYSTVELLITEAKEEIVVLPRTEQPSVMFTETEKKYLTVEIYNRSEEDVTLNVDVYLNGEFVTEYEENMFADSKTIVTFDDLKSDEEYTFKVTALASEHRISLTETYRHQTLETYGNKTVNTFTGSVDLLFMVFQFVGLAITGLLPFAITGVVIYLPIRYIKKRKGNQLFEEKEEEK